MDRKNNTEKLTIAPPLGPTEVNKPDEENSAKEEVEKKMTLEGQTKGEKTRVDNPLNDIQGKSAFSAIKVWSKVANKYGLKQFYVLVRSYPSDYTEGIR